MWLLLLPHRQIAERGAPVRHRIAGAVAAGALLRSRRRAATGPVPAPCPTAA
ncbi:hypothetical protein [Streptomyces sp. NPDC048196]|uniref:hypothetical protein n=1 Tax=Streptomyces sp. NPDC048196 TaxID=3154712 RepID=UPI003406428F